MSPHDHRVLFQISPDYSRDKGRLPMCYSPVCHASKLAFDLHALDMSPAFTLSQDQTLNFSCNKLQLVEFVLILLSKLLYLCFLIKALKNFKKN